MRPHRHRHDQWRSFLLAIACVLQMACTLAWEQTLIGESPMGTVYLERLPSRGATAKFSGPIGAFQATHPIALPPDLLARALVGLRIGPDQSAAHEPRPLPTPLFTDEETAFLAPLIAAALSRAAPDQRVRFSVSSGNGRLVQGTVFADRALLHVTLSRYEPRNAEPPVVLDSMELSSIHRSAQHRHSVPQSWMLQETGLPSISLDYQALKNLSESSPNAQAMKPALSAQSPAARETASPSQAEIDSLKELLARQADELRKLKEEVDALRRQAPAGQARPPKQAGKKRLAPSNQQPATQNGDKHQAEDSGPQP